MVWKRADLESDTSWLTQFSATELETIDRAVRGVADKRVFEFGVDDFPLPGMEEFFSDLRHELDQGRCLKLIRGIDVDRYSIEELYKLYWGFGCNLGSPIIQNAKGELLGEVTDRGNDYNANNVRGYTTSQAIRFHCDSGDVVGLLCVHPSKSGGQSRICCSAAVHNEMLATTPELLVPLYEGFHWDLRGEGATGDKNETSWKKVPVYHYHEHRLSMRFNGKTITDGMRKAGKPLNELQAAASCSPTTMSCTRGPSLKTFPSRTANAACSASGSIFRSHDRCATTLPIDLIQGHDRAPQRSKAPGTGPGLNQRRQSSGPMAQATATGRSIRGSLATRFGLRYEPRSRHAKPCLHVHR